MPGRFGIGHHNASAGSHSAERRVWYGSYNSRRPSWDGYTSRQLHSTPPRRLSLPGGSYHTERTVVHIGNDLDSNFAFAAAADADETVNAESGFLHCLANLAGKIRSHSHHSARRESLVMAHRQADVPASDIVVEYGGVIFGKPGQENQPARVVRH